MTTLLQRMLGDMRLRRLAQNTQASYIHRVSLFAGHSGKPLRNIGPEETPRIRSPYELLLVRGRCLEYLLSMPA